jgi:hypothetical protein
MSHATVQALEHALEADILSLGHRAHDERFAVDLYRSLANRRWFRIGDSENAVSLSWARAEDIVNLLRRRHGKEPLTLFQTGHEGELSDEVREELRRLGWASEPLDTGEHDPAHVTDPEHPPGAGHRSGEARDHL